MASASGAALANGANFTDVDLISLREAITAANASAAGDVVIWDGDPLELSSAPMRVFIDGVEQPLSTHQSRLRDRYRDLDESDLPKAYDW